MNALGKDFGRGEPLNENYFPSTDIKDDSRKEPSNEGPNVQIFVSFTIEAPSAGL